MPCHSFTEVSDELFTKSPETNNLEVRKDIPGYYGAHLCIFEERSDVWHGLIAYNAAPDGSSGKDSWNIACYRVGPDAREGIHIIIDTGLDEDTAFFLIKKLGEGKRKELNMDRVEGYCRSLAGGGTQVRYCRPSP